SAPVPASRAALQLQARRLERLSPRSEDVLSHDPAVFNGVREPGPSTTAPLRNTWRIVLDA
ncbi:MAG TPA: hypothetical protein VE401_12065, partial [Solirubrobacterales bacterium]|nr:hypothetical protein [Solirubrobacterales bacterium]